MLTKSTDELRGFEKNTFENDELSNSPSILYKTKHHQMKGNLGPSPYSYHQARFSIVPSHPREIKSFYKLREEKIQ